MAGGGISLFGSGVLHFKFCGRPESKEHAWTFISKAGAPWSPGPSFRCDPFARDVALDPGRATAPRMTVPHMLPSSEQKLSAPAMSDLSRLNLTPHAIAVYASQPLSPGSQATLATKRVLPLT